VVLQGRTKAIEVWEPLQDNDPRGDFISRYAGAYAMLKAQVPGRAGLRRPGT